ncbi:MAG: peptidoglycan DD-metalloendopeptidase family protein [Myxococcota bacterium]|nr:peptidoglycan DD-metalloendopeptidase family protein [Myxococcota bacterium]
MLKPPSGMRSVRSAIDWLTGLILLVAASSALSVEPIHSVAQFGDTGVVADLQIVSVFSGPALPPEGPSSRMVAEYAPVSIDSLPLRAAGLAERTAWSTSPPLTVVTKGSLDHGESLSVALRRQGITSATIHLVASELSRVFDFRHARPGDRYRLAQDPQGMVLDFRYVVSPEKSFTLHWDGDQYRVRAESAPLHAQLSKVSGTVNSSLYEAIVDLGEKIQLANDFAEIFAWDIDFSRNVRPGDDFQILFERLYRTDEDGHKVYVKPGRILAARYHGGVGEYEAVYFAADGSEGGYYRPDGAAIERAFLKAPLEFNRISSSFSLARQHPILKVVRPHRGIDYAAQPGTPVWSVADGTVIFRGRAGASGNLVKVKHRNGYVSYYAHLSRFEPGLKVGDSVDQKQLIGYVGQTGLATGPHVCFRVQQDGRYVNPLDIASPAGEPIDRTRWAEFSSRRDRLLSHLGVPTLLAAEEAL